MNTMQITDKDNDQNMYLFEGEDYKKKNKKEEAPKPQFIDVKRQKVKAITYDIEKYYQ